MRIALVFFLTTIISGATLAQSKTPEQIEKDLLTEFKQIGYWDKHRESTKVDAIDAISRSNDSFAKKLKFYTQKYPATIAQKFALLENEKLSVLSSDDGLFRIYSWDNQQGDFDNVMQYKTGLKTMSIFIRDTINTGDEGYVYGFDKLYTLKVAMHTYYLGVYRGEFSHTAYGMGIRLFEIVNSKLSNQVNIIKTTTGLHSNIYYNYNVFSQYANKWPIINFDNKTNQIYVPVLSTKDKFYGKYITYKFTGKYFEKVRN